jgi:D-alanyl-D-alanine carboxypeptidase (penicillin-binding protein 5/6)
VLTLSATDAALYNSYVAQGGSVVKVDIGEQISELQVLQAMMLPSANNLADSLAIWAFGSLSAYKTAATAWLAQHNLTQTHIGSDASGFSPTTISTAHDLVLLGELVMQTPVLANIVGQSSVSGIPVVGTIKNVNFLLGSYGIIGIKTGNNNQDPGVYVSASQTTINNQKVTLVTSLVGAPALRQALNDSLPLIKSAQANFQSVSVIKAGTVVGYYHSPWGVVVTAIASKDLAVTFWGGSTVSSSVNLQPVSADSEAGAVAGSLSAPASFLTGKQSALIKLQSPTSKPSLRWRLLHPIK